MVALVGTGQERKGHGVNNTTSFCSRSNYYFSRIVQYASMYAFGSSRGSRYSIYVLVHTHAHTDYSNM